MKLPVWPYANIVALYPANTSLTNAVAVSSNTLDCVESGPKIRSNWNGYDISSEITR
jgi:hypothetical protein